MFQRIVVGTDGSETATNALRSAAKLAAQSGAELHIVSGYHGRSGLRVTGAGSGVEGWMVSSTDAVEGILARRCRHRPAGEDRRDDAPRGR